MNRRARTVALFAALGAAVSPAVSPAGVARAQSAPEYVETPAERRGPAVLALSDGGALVVGGRGADSAPQRSVWRFDVRTGAFHTLASVPEAPDPALVFSVRSGVLAIAGPSGRAYLFDLARDRWTPAGSLRTARTGAAGALRPDGSVWVCGGTAYGAARTLGDCERFDPYARAFTVVARMRTPRASHGMASLANGDLVVVGGDRARVVEGRNTSVPLRSIERWQRSTRRFTRVGTVSSARYGVSVAPLGDGSLLVAGGTGDYGENWGVGSERVRLGAGVAELAGCTSDAERSLGTTLLRLGDGGVLVVGALSAAAPMRVSATGRCAGELPEIDSYGAAGWALLRDGSVLGVGPRAVRFRL